MQTLELRINIIFKMSFSVNFNKIYQPHHSQKNEQNIYLENNSNYTHSHTPTTNIPDFEMSTVYRFRHYEQYIQPYINVEVGAQTGRYLCVHLEPRKTIMFNAV